MAEHQSPGQIIYMVFWKCLSLPHDVLGSSEPEDTFTGQLLCARCYTECLTLLSVNLSVEDIVHFTHEWCQKDTMFTS